MKVRKLKKTLSEAGFTCLPKRGKGSHNIWLHQQTNVRVIQSGNNNRDVLPYQKKDVQLAISEVERLA